jgi:4-diphosphocytidyl-2-C-methyl-D-erythritol kinase
MATRSATVPSLAKVNLDLRVLGKRPDGYHELRTIFQTISLADRIGIDYTPGGSRISLSLAGNVEIPNNLILRAAEAVMRVTKAKGAVSFTLDKRIPMGGGLGGGSSNAAAILLALPVLLGRMVPLATLHQLAVDLGSDVAFFLYGGTALGLGRGSELYPLADIARASALVATPGIHVSTPDAYQALKRPAGGVMPSIYRDPGNWQSDGVNDFEAVVFAQYPELARLARRMKRAGAATVRMSGSGSSIFSMFPGKEAEASAIQSLAGIELRRVEFVSRQRYRNLWWNSLKRHTLVKTWPPRSRYDQ